MFNRISQAEHDRLMGEAAAQHTARYAALAALVPDADATDTDAVVAAITARLTASNDMEAEITALSADVDQAQQLATTLRTRAEAAEAQVNGITALFGAKAQAPGFNLVQAVGDVVPESFTRAIDEEEPKGPKVDAKVRTEFDVLADDLAAGKISHAEFRRKCSEVKFK